ncbi:glycerophosphodiester phosphodiesterase [Georgenia yuyongxinii]|uniref:Glycerophosphodiester phosphodiesterase n=1 Tax=Georgenia yuyongxinii TaxID=2589797 RepID=A0A5B8C9J9_9MICO|nr:glycerophosphodiester phosphodiesterase family protein [Georgenia yuyongxinii]QDC26820.1 glycerophosphodiester phosphodiesterase [Georgenia yuyongxinii]
MLAAAASLLAPTGLYGSHPGPYAVAHRGGAGLAAENTLAAFERSAALGVTYLETDVRTTADGVPLAFHDRALDRVTDLRGPVAAHPWAHVRRARVLGTEPVVALEDLLGSFAQACFMIDVKEARSVAPTIAAIRRTGTAGRVCVAGGWDTWLAAIRRECGPALTTALGWRALTALIGCARTGSRPPGAIATAPFAHVAWRLGAMGIMSAPRVATRLVSMAHDLGVRVITWTVDDAPSIHRLLHDGVDGVITDRPDVLREVLVGRGMWVPRR